MKANLLTGILPTILCDNEKVPALLWYGMLTTGILVICCIILLGYMNWEAGTVEVTALSVPGAPDNIVFIADPHVQA